MSGSRPEADASTRSTGIGALPLAFRSASTRAVIAVISACDVDDRFEPPESVGSYPVPAADGGREKYSGWSKVWPIRLEPIVCPSAAIIEPLAWLGNMACAAAVTTTG